MSDGQSRTGRRDGVSEVFDPPSHPITPDGRYLVVRGRLWRRSNPGLPEGRRTELVSELMQARRAVGVALRQEGEPGLAAARAAVDRAKVALGERGAVWWEDGAPDLNRHMVAGTPYAAWFAQLPEGCAIGEGTTFAPSP